MQFYMHSTFKLWRKTIFAITGPFRKYPADTNTEMEVPDFKTECISHNPMYVCKPTFYFNLLYRSLLNIFHLCAKALRI